MNKLFNAGKRESRNPWAWVPSLYFAEGIPFIVVMTVSVIMYKRMGISNSQIALYTSWLYLPWVIKPLWSPIVDILKTKRYWIIVTQMLIGAGLAGIAFTIPVPNFFRYTLAFFWLLAFSSATHDIAVDGFYMLGLTKHEQALYVGIRSVFYRFAMLTGQGLLVILAGHFETSTGLPPLEFQVVSSTEQKTTPELYRESFIDTIKGADQKIIANSTHLVVSTDQLSKAYADSIINKVRTWNIGHEFYVDDREIKSKSDSQPSWWSEHISQKLESFLRKHFRSDELVESSEVSGNITLASFHLLNPPDEDEEVVVNFSRDRGDKSISLVEGFRFTFTKKNWDTPALCAIQLDPKLEKESTVLFTARSGNIPLAWALTFIILAVLFVCFFIYHRFILPYPKSDALHSNDQQKGSSFLKEFTDTFVLFFKKKEIGVMLAFLLLYRLAESQLVKLASPFLLDAQEFGGLGLTTGNVGLIYGTVGMIALLSGGLLGGFLAARNGLRHWIWWMIIAMNLPNLVYVYLSQVQPESMIYIYLSVAIEQLGYGFGFTAYMLYMIYVSEGKHKTAHFAITTGFMALGMMIPGMLSGWLQEIIGYPNFFIWVMFCTIPSFIVLLFVKIDPEFGLKKEDKTDTGKNQH